MAKTERYTVEEVLEAIEGTYGILVNVAKKLGCVRQTVANYAKRHPEIKEALKQEKETALDLAEQAMFEIALDDRDPKMLRYYLSRLGKDRGYTERTEVVGNEDIKIVYENDWRKKGE